LLRLTHGSFGHARLQIKVRTQLAEVSASLLRLLAAGDKEHSRGPLPCAEGAQQRPGKAIPHIRPGTADGGLRRDPAPDPRIARSGPRREAPASRRGWKA
jgi:hypothetical protein